jgi:hypothetical protein
MRATASGPVPAGFWRRAAWAVVRRPHLWSIAVRVLRRSTPRGWWRRPPFLPLPDADFLRFRFETAYGHRGHAEVDDFVGYLSWCRTLRLEQSHGRGSRPSHLSRPVPYRGQRVGGDVTLRAVRGRREER